MQVAVPLKAHERGHMSKNNDVNPAQNKVAGRERMGESLGQDKNKQAF